MEKDRRKIYFTADLHFLHYNSMKFHPWRMDACGLTQEEVFADPMMATEVFAKWLINKWNETVRRQDEIYILGDFCLANKEETEKIVNQLRGRKHLILGNHDKSLKGLERYFESVSQIKEAKFTNNQFKFIDPNETFCVEMCHYPLLTWNRRCHGSTCIMGHCHGSLDEFNENSLELRVDVGIDGKFAKACGGFIELEQLYNHFCAIRDAAGCKTFEEYQEWLMKRQGFRM